MNLYTVQIGGTPIAVVSSEDAAEARKLFRRELTAARSLDLQVGGAPVWNGKAALDIRAASDEERLTWTALKTAAISADGIADNKKQLCFLASVTDPIETQNDLA